MGMTSPAAWRGLIAAALLGAAAGFQPVLTMMQGAGASVGGRVAPRAPGFAAREACSSGLSAGARAAGPRAAAGSSAFLACAAPPAPVRGCTSSVAAPWARLKQVALSLLAVLGLMAASLLCSPVAARAAEAVHKTAAPPIHSQVVEVASGGVRDVTSRQGFRLVMAAANKDKTAPVDAGSVMLSMRTPEQKQRLTTVVTAAYVAVWAFFYFTHDSGEVSE